MNASYLIRSALLDALFLRLQISNDTSNGQLFSLYHG